MLAWMLYCVLLGLLAALGAAALERALQLYRRPVRWVWAAALAASVTLPWLLAPAGREDGLESAATAPVAFSGAAATSGGDALPRVAADAVPRWAERADAALPYAWLAASLGLAAALAVASVRLRLRRRAWRRARVAGAPVLVSDRTGPAVVGFVRPDIVLPRWMLSWAEPLQRLVVTHEREHIRARDPGLLLAGLAAVAVMPWNPALWWQVRRLRLAIELDCDARVLRGEPDVAAYGRLLLEVGRSAASGPLAAAAFSEPRSFLERRIRHMTKRVPRGRLGRAALGVGFCLGLASMAAFVPAAQRPALAGVLPGGLRVLGVDTVPPRLVKPSRTTAKGRGEVVRVEGTVPAVVATARGQAASVEGVVPTVVSVGRGQATAVSVDPVIVEGRAATVRPTVVSVGRGQATAVSVDTVIVQGTASTVRPAVVSTVRGQAVSIEGVVPTVVSTARGQAASVEGVVPTVVSTARGQAVSVGGKVATTSRERVSVAGVGRGVPVVVTTQDTVPAHVRAERARRAEAEAHAAARRARSSERTHRREVEARAAEARGHATVRARDAEVHAAEARGQATARADRHVTEVRAAEARGQATAHARRKETEAHAAEVRGQATVRARSAEAEARGGRAGSAAEVERRAAAAGGEVRARSEASSRSMRETVLRLHPALRTERTGRTAYVYLVLDARGRVVRNELTRTAPARNHFPEGILRRFPDLREGDLESGGIVTYDAGELGRDPVVVFWTYLEPGRGTVER